MRMGELFSLFLRSLLHKAPLMRGFAAFFFVALCLWAGGCLSQGGECRSALECSQGSQCLRGFCQQFSITTERPPEDSLGEEVREGGESKDPEGEPNEDEKDALLPEERAFESPTPEILVEQTTDAMPEKTAARPSWMQFFHAEEITIRDTRRLPDGDILLGGSFRGEKAQMAGMEVVGHALDRQAFLMRLSPTGEARWVKAWGGAGEESIEAIAVDPQGQIYIAGFYTSHPLVLGSSSFPHRGDKDLFLASLDGQGAIRWAISAGSPSMEVASALEVTEDGTLYVAGQILGKEARLLDGRAYDTSRTLGFHTGMDFLTSLDTEGMHRWTISYGSPAPASALPRLSLAPPAIAPAPSSTTQAVYISNSFDLELPASNLLGARLAATHQGQDPYTMLVRADGVSLWADSIYSFNGDGTPQALLSTPTGILMFGGFYGDLPQSDLSPSRPFSSQTSGFLAFWEHSGALRWVKAALAQSEASTLRFQSAAYNASGIHLLGEMQGQILFGEDAASLLDAQGGYALFFSRFDLQGRWRSTQRLEAAEPLFAQGRLLLDQHGAYLFAGRTQSTSLLWKTQVFPTGYNSSARQTVFLFYSGVTP